MEARLSSKLREIQKGLLLWYGFKPGGAVLYVGEQSDALAEGLASQGLIVACAPLGQTLQESWQRQHRLGFDYLVSVAGLETCGCPEQALAHWKTLLKPDGHMLLGMNNRFGTRYFCGDRDPYTGRNFDGVENYRRAYVNDGDTFTGRMYDQATLKQMLRRAGWGSFQFFSVFPDLGNPSFLYAEGYCPNEDLINRVRPVYNCPDTVFLEEEVLYEGIVENGMFHQMANAYLIECALGGELSDVCHVTGSLDREKEDAILTVARKTGVVEKHAVYPEGQRRLGELAKHGAELGARGLKAVEGAMVGGVYRMPYVSAESGQTYLRRLFQTDMEKFYKEMDRFRDLILQSSEVAKPDLGDGEGATLKKGYFDLVPLNSFHVDGEFVFFDQEFCLPNYPANAIIFRMVATFYSVNKGLHTILPIERLYERYGLVKHLARWRQAEGETLGKLLNWGLFHLYNGRHRGNDEVIHSNRQRLNMTEGEYYRTFVDIFRGVGTKKLFLFGSGTFTKRFLAMYGKDCPVRAIIDNNEKKWGETMDGVGICPPDILKGFAAGEYKVIVCIKNYLSVARQLEGMGVRDFSVYDSGRPYPARLKLAASGTGVGMGASQECQAGHVAGVGAAQACQVEYVAGADVPKKYQVGYVAGAFDMFHVGHVNLLRRAKEQCGYLIVGLLSDEGVFRTKHRPPVIPGEEREAVVRACRYVDQVDILPDDYAGIRDAYKMYHFDCQFSGDDHRDSPLWLAEKEFLEKNGADIVFFPYTEKTSSTKIRGQLQRDGDPEGKGA